jgi:hypothetical protein
MRKILHWILVLTVAAIAWGATPVKKKAAAKAPAKTGSRKPAIARSSKKGATKGKTARTTAKPATWRNRQMAPTPDRYREIQDALAAKGYLGSDNCTGAWDQTSVEALKRFQTDQNLGSTGKINSLSLIALGLGPKHGAPPPEAGEQKQ